MKRFRARAKGRASGILKPYSNLTIILSEQKPSGAHCVTAESVNSAVAVAKLFELKKYDPNVAITY